MYQRSVIDFACGSGVSSIVALKNKARKVEAVDIDPTALIAVGLNASLNNVGPIYTCEEHIVGRSMPDVDVLIAGDILYDQEMAETCLPWFRLLTKKGVRVLVGDPGRVFMPKAESNDFPFRQLATYPLTGSMKVENHGLHAGTVWEVV